MRTSISGALALPALMGTAAAGPGIAAGTHAVADKASCERAVREVRAERDYADITNKLKTELDEMLAIAGELCSRGKFSSAERLLSIARGMVAGD